jgi:ribosomal protein S18 acetylase RimI-like enzyme
VQTLTGRDQVLEATGGTPYAQFSTAMVANIIGLANAEGRLWVGDGPLGRLAHATGPERAVDELIDTGLASGLLDARWINVPRRPRDRAPAGLEIREEWEMRWSTAPPPVTPGAERVVAVDDAAAVNALLDVAMPDSMLRPGHRMAHQWYGIWAAGPEDPAAAGHPHAEAGAVAGDPAGRLVACAVDRSTISPDPSTPVVGVVGAVAVHPAYRRQGLGAAVSAAVTERLRSAHDLVTLGVMEGNNGAIRIYERLGYTGVVQITSLRIPAPEPGHTRA